MLLSTVCSKPSIPDEFLRDLRPIKRRPTFGNWPRILEGTTSKSRSEELRLFRQLPSFVFHELLPGLKGGASAPADKGLIEVRNILVLGGTMKKKGSATRSWNMESLLEASGAKMSFLDAACVCFIRDWLAL